MLQCRFAVEYAYGSFTSYYYGSKAYLSFTAKEHKKYS